MECDGQETSFFVIRPLLVAKSGGLVKENRLKHIPLLYLAIATHVERAVVRYCSGEFSELIMFISELIKTGSAKVSQWMKLQFA